MLTTLAIENYRSIHHLVTPLGRLNVVSGPNASGKSNVYRALRLFASAAGTRASAENQVWVVTHSTRLIAALEEDPGCNSIVLDKSNGETTIAGQRPLDEPSWHWPE